MNRSQKTSRVEIPIPPPSSTKEFSEGRRAQLGVEDTISRRAYELYEERGREHGHAEEDWLRAEAEVTAGLSHPENTAPSNPAAKTTL
jgi:hypothetical protein